MSVATTNFINAVKAGAMAGQVNYGILASLTIAQAINESGWGKSSLSLPPYNNLFGIKAEFGYTGTKALFQTREWVTDHYVYVDSYFRTYPNWDASVEDHGAFLTVGTRYDNLIGVTDYVLASHLIWEDKYASEPSYPEILISIIEGYGLHAYDTGTYTGTPAGGYIPSTGGGYTPSTPTGGLSTIRDLQNFLNAGKIRDNAGRELIVDGILGRGTQEAVANAKKLIQNMLI